MHNTGQTGQLCVLLPLLQLTAYALPGCNAHPPHSFLPDIPQSTNPNMQYGNWLISCESNTALASAAHLFEVVLKPLTLVRINLADVLKYNPGSSCSQHP